MGKINPGAIWIHAAGPMLLAVAGCARTPSAQVPVPSPAITQTAESNVPASTSTAPLAAGQNAGEPALATMALASAPQKLGAPVDLRYQIEGDASAGQPVTLHLAAVPRVAGTNLTMSIKEESGISAKASRLSAQKVSAATAYRQDVSVSKLAGGPEELHVLVTIEVPEGSAHSWFTIPLQAAPAAGKKNPIKME